MIKVYMHLAMPEFIFVGDHHGLVTMGQMLGCETLFQLEDCPLDGFIEIGEL